MRRDEDSMRELMEPLLEGETSSVDADVEHRRRDGSTYIFDAQLQLSVEDLQVFVVVTGRDVTESRAQEAAVRQSEARFRTISSATPEAIGIIRLSDARFVDVNDRFEGFSGYRREEVVGLTWEDLGLDAPNPIGRNLVKQLVREQCAIHTEVSFVRKDGEQRQADVTLDLVEISGELCAMAVARDITERKQTEQQVRRLAAVVDSSPDAIVMADRAGYIQSWNPAAEALFGYSSQEALDCLDLHLPASRSPPVAEEHGGLAVRHTRPRQLLIMRRTSIAGVGGLVRHPSTSRAARSRIAAAYAKDIRETRRAREEINRLAAVVQSTGDAVATFGLDGQIESWNPAAEALFGYTAEEARQRHVGRFVPDDAVDEAMADWEALKAGSTVPLRDTGLVYSDWTRLDVSLASFPIRDAAGQVTSVASMVRDISERKQVEQAMARLAAIVESSDDAIYAMDRDRQVLSWNSAAEQLFGYSADEMIGQRVYRIVPEDDVEPARHDVNRALAGESPPARDTQRIRKDGTLVD
ncbi:MAG: PAS domain S-box protein [Dehalococcoidia bacterium]|nr:PAS domain S-box protein [Dehalococcoidia bacterium]